MYEDKRGNHMAVLSSLSVLSPNSVPKFCSSSSDTKHTLVSSQQSLLSLPSNSCGILKESSTKLKAAGFAEIEPDLREEPVEQWSLNSVDADDFEYGEWDGHHTYFEGEVEKGNFWEVLKGEYDSVDPPIGFQAFISWAFPPAIAAGMYFNVPGEYLYIGAGVFATVFCIIEMNKPDQPHNFEPEIYNMERGARDKLISDYNTMDIWEFNEKYGDLWDFTLKKDDITKR